MPWTPADASAHSKSITTDKQRRAWAEIANSALTRCLKDGGKQADCEGRAIAQANGVAAKIQESDDDATVAQMVEAALADSASVVLPPSSPTDAAGEHDAGSVTGLAEAATLKQRAQALLRDLNSLLTDKQLSKDMTDQLGSMRAALRKKWADLVDAPAADEPMAAATEAARRLAEGSALLQEAETEAPIDEAVTTSDMPSDQMPAAGKRMDKRVGGGVDRSKIPAEDFAGKNRSYPIVTPQDVADAAASIGRAGPDNYSTDELKARILAIAKRKGAAFVAQLPKAWQDGKAQEAEQLPLDGDLVPLAENETEVELVEFAVLVEA